jgi:competence ComEA-like helix-hairpin-helix protein
MRRWLETFALLFILASNASAAQLLNLNTATKVELVAIGLSESQALQVISHREKNGAFLQVEELTAVPQVTKQAFEKIRARVTVDE